jgi:hypothetical protein
MSEISWKDRHRHSLPKVDELESFAEGQIRISLPHEVVSRLDAQQLGPEQSPAAENERQDAVLVSIS